MSSKKQILTFKERLKALNPPDELYWEFADLIEISENYQADDTLADLLKVVAKNYNWTVPWEYDDEKLTFRANTLRYNHPEYKKDCGRENTPAEEQAYRRGYQHGFAFMRQELGYGYGEHPTLAETEAQITAWRFSRIQSRTNIIWGGVPFEPIYNCKIQLSARRSGLSPKLRWKILKRDNKKCCTCGASAQDGAVLEVDHIKPVIDGGSDNEENLQTLCFDCNRGKGTGYN